MSLKQYFAANKHSIYFKYILGLLCAKIVLILFHGFSPFTHPHIIRQTDTMGVSLSYWLRWSHKGFTAESLLPAVLNSGDGVGIQSMELPLYNLMFAPLFYFGVEWGRTLSIILSYLLIVLLTWVAFRVWRGKSIVGIKVDHAFPLLLLISVSSVFSYRFMPDYLSFILVLIAMGLSFEEKKPKFLLSLVLATLGLLVKPTAVIAFGPLLLVRPFSHLIKSIISYIAPAFLVAVLYYTKGIAYLRSKSDLPEYFDTKFENPIHALSGFFSNPSEIYKLFEKSFFGPSLIYPLLLEWIYLLVKRQKFVVSPLIYILLLQIITIALLDGKHAFVHDYYFIGLSFVAALLTVKFFEVAPKPLVYIYLLILTVGTFERMFYGLRPIGKDHHYAQCKELKNRNPQFPWNQGYSFRSSHGFVPYIGLCFGEKHSSRVSEYGIYFADEPLPADCKAIDKTKDIVLADCRQGQK